MILLPIENSDELLKAAISCLTTYTGALEITEIFEQDVYEKLPNELKRLREDAETLLKEYDRLQQQPTKKSLFEMPAGKGSDNGELLQEK